MIMQDKKGVTLVEVMIALVILLFVFMGLIQASLLSIDFNVRGEIRDEAVRIASESLAMTRAANFTSIDDTGGGWDAVLNPPNPPGNFPRNFRNFTLTYNVFRQVTDLDANNKQVMVRCNYTYKDEPSSYEFITTVRR